MNTTWTKISALALMVLLNACGGGGSGGGTPPGGGGTSATGVDWTWVGGDNIAGQPSIFGASGVVAASGVPGATEGASSWTDTAGNLWLFGGSKESINIDVNNLWKYDGANWLWMNGNQGADNPQSNYGTISPNNPGPGARQYAATWLSRDSVNSIDYLWLFGGYVRINAAGNTKPANDLWKYNTSSGQWTWVGGSSIHSQAGNYGTINAMPGARYGAISWRDSLGNFWLFGGYGYAETGSAGALNDLWKFDPNNNLWTWVGGSKLTGQLGSYGTKGLPASGNVPGGRYLGVSWIDASNNLWLFGGTGYDATGVGDFNDLWKFGNDPAVVADYQKWTWMSGDNKSGQFGNFGTAGIVAASNVPGSRRTAVAWTDYLGNFWLFGGAENHPNNSTGTGTDNLNDLWKFNTATTQWVWMSGSNVPNKFGTYGIQGSTAPANVPGARDTAVAWTSADGKACWLLGGAGYDGSGQLSYSTVPMNDFWNFVPK
jgi:hypothetical protein